MKLPLTLLLSLVCAGSLFAQSLLQSPFGYQFMGKRGVTYGWNKKDLYFRDDLATTMLARSFTHQTLRANGWLVNNFSWVRTNYLDGLGTLILLDYVPPSLRFYSILGSDLSSIQGLSFNRRFETFNGARHRLFGNAEFHHNNRQRDRNVDGFTDNPLIKNPESFVQYHFQSKNRRVDNYTTFASMHENFLQGEKGISKYDETVRNVSSFRLQHGSSYYGVRNVTEMRLDDERRNTLMLDAAGKWFSQRSYFSTHYYEGRQEGMNLNAFLKSRLSPLINIEAGGEYRFDNKEETIDSVRLGSKTNTGSLYVQSTTPIGKHVELLLNYRVNYNARLGWNHNAAMKLDVLKRNDAGIYLFSSLNSDFTSPVAENLQYLAGSREINIDESDYYQPDRFVKSGIAFRLFKYSDIFYAQLHYHYIYYTERSILDFHTSPAAVNIYREQGSYDHTVETKINIGGYYRKFVSAEVLYRFDYVKAQINGMKTGVPFYPKHNLMVSLNISPDRRGGGYEYPLVNITGLLTSPMEVPANEGSGLAKTKTIFTLNTYVYFPLDQIRRYSYTQKDLNALRWFDVMLGFENMTGYKQDNVIIRNTSQNPDSYEGLNLWTPLSGFRFYFGIVLKPQIK